ncbi:MAG: hypothetical protein ABUR63_05935 [Verrucomicrobiota bacterium]
MKRRTPPTFALAVALIAGSALAVLPTSAARADEEDDIQRQIDTQKAGVPDLEHLDVNHAAAVDIQRLRDWLALAWDLRNKHESDAAREVLDRCLSQSELIRQVIATSVVKSDLAAKEVRLKQTRADIEQKKKALQEAVVRKKALEQAVGS